KLNIISSKFLISLAYRLEKWIYRNAYLISGQTKGIVVNIKERFPSKKVLWFPNGIDLDFFESSNGQVSWRENFGISKDEFVLLYAGIIGHAQGLEVILQAADLLHGKPIKFLIVGDGPEKNRLVKLANQRKLSSVIFHPNLQKREIPSLIHACDAYIVPLRRLDLFKGAIPSKLFEPLSIGKPILLGVDGEARQLFIEEGRGGLYFEPENAASLAEQIVTLQSDKAATEELGRNGQRYVKENFNRVNIHDQFLEQLKAV
ncbi:MAG: glycosyltransferase family 4 protein, partial [Bacteroidota bacterium]|nr:glycosyltransferase family 4 protein [Bacteroidota bacterium]